MTLERNGLVTSKYQFPGGKEWMVIVTPPEGSPPSFEDWFEMVRILAEVEVTKYARRRGMDPESREAWERFSVLPRDFLVACFEYDATYAVLRTRFGLPR